MLAAPGALVSPATCVRHFSVFLHQAHATSSGPEKQREKCLSPSEDTRAPALLSFICRFHHIISVKEKRASTDFLLEWIMSLAGFEGRWRQRTGECGRLFHFPRQCFQHSRGSKDAAVPPPYPCVTGVAEVGCLKAKIALGPACMQISVKKRAVFSWTSAWVSPLLPCSAFSILSEPAALAPGSKSRPLWVWSRAYMAPYFVSRHHASTFIHAL